MPTVLGEAFAAVTAGFTGSNVTVYTPNPLNSSQEFLQVTPVPLPAPLTLLLSGLGCVGALLRHERVARAALA